MINKEIMISMKSYMKAKNINIRPDNRRCFLSETSIEKIRQQFYETTATLF